MKKVFNYCVFAFALLLTSSFALEVNAKEYLFTDIPDNSYIIGTHLFNSDLVDQYDSDFYNMSIDSNVVMLGSSTINTSKMSSSDDFIIYERIAEDWVVNSLTGEDILDIPEKFDITHINGQCIDERCNGTTITVTFDENNNLDDFITDAFDGCTGEECNPVVEVPYGNKLSAGDMPTVKKRVGYQFKYWTVKGEDTQFDLSQALTENVVLEPYWEAVSYTIKYDVNGGNGSVNDTTCNFAAANASETCVFADGSNLTKEGYHFVGWSAAPSSDASSSNDNYYLVGSSIETILSDEKIVTVYAVWESDFTIDYDLNGGTYSGSVALPETYTINNDGIEVSIPTTDLTRTGYTFSNWEVVKGSASYENGTLIVNTVSPVKLKAVWTPITYSFKYNSKTLVTCTYDKECKVPEYTDLKTGEVFKGWEDINVVGSRIGTSVTNYTSKNEVINVKPKIEYVNYSISYDYAGGSLTSGQSNPSSYTIEKKDIEIKVPTREGYTFDGWDSSDNVKVSSDTRIAIDGTGDVTLKAIWTPITYTISYYDEDSEKDVTLATCTYDVECSIPEYDAPDGMIFEGWLDTAKTDFTIGSSVLNYTNKATNIKVEPDYEYVQYGISYQYNGGSGAVNQSVYNIETGSLLLNSVSKTGYNFTGWSVESGSATINNQNVISFTGTGDIKVQANFEELEYTLVVKNGDKELYNDTCSYESCIVNVNNPSVDGKNFVGWKDSLTNFIYAKGERVVIDTTKYDEGDTITLEAYYEDKEAKEITYVLNGGNFAATVNSKFTPGIGLSDLPEPTNFGYDFVGWSTVKDSSASVITSIDANTTTDVTLYAIWNKKTYNVYLKDANGNDLGTDSMLTCTYGNSESCILNYANYSNATENIIGWALSNDNNKTNLFFGDGIQANYLCEFSNKLEDGISCNMYAVTEKTFTITYNRDGGITKDATDEEKMVEFINGGEVITIPSLQKEGYTFNGWDVSANAVVTESSTEGYYDVKLTKAGNVTLTAKWDGLVTLDYNGGTLNEKTSNSYVIPVGNTLVINDTPVKEDYVFSGWEYDVLVQIPSSANSFYVVEKVDKGYTIPAFSNRLDGSTVEGGYTYIERAEECESNTGCYYLTSVSTSSVNENGDYYYAENYVFYHVVFVDGVKYYETTDVVNSGDSIVVDENITYTAIWTPVYTVNFYSGNELAGSHLGTVDVIENKVIDFDDVEIVSGDVTDFAAETWLLNGSVFDVTSEITSDIDLYLYVEKPHTVTFMDGNDIVATVDVADNEPINTTDIEVVDGYTIDLNETWMLENEVFDFTTPITGDITLTKSTN